MIFITLYVKQQDFFPSSNWIIYCTRLRKIFPSRRVPILLHLYIP